MHLRMREAKGKTVLLQDPLQLVMQKVSLPLQCSAKS